MSLHLRDQMQVQLSNWKNDKRKLTRRGLLGKQGCSAYSDGARLQAEISYLSKTLSQTWCRETHLLMDAINNLGQEAVQGLYRKKQAREEAVRAATE